MVSPLLGTMVARVVDADNCNRPTIAMIGLSGDTVGVLASVMPAEWNRRGFEDGKSFLDSDDASPIDCVVMEVARLGPSSLALYDEWHFRDPWATIVIIAESGWSLDRSVLFYRGAVRLLPKPFDLDALQRTVTETARQGFLKRTAILRRRRSGELVARLTPLEQQVVEGLYGGLPHKRIAKQLGISLRTVDYRRKCALRKLEVKTVAEMIRMIAEIELAEPQ